MGLQTINTTNTAQKHSGSEVHSKQACFQYFFLEEANSVLPGVRKHSLLELARSLTAMRNP